MIAETPNPPYYAVIFTSESTAGDNGYIVASTTNKCNHAIEVRSIDLLDEVTVVVMTHGNR